MESPIAKFSEWFEIAKEKLGEEQASTTCLATTVKYGVPSARMILLKQFDESGFCFFTNLGSRKARELESNPYAAMCFYWQELGWQVRIEGKAEQVKNEEADAYFDSRHPRSKVGAIVSKQSHILRDYDQLISAVNNLEAELKEDQEIKRPFYWSGFRIIPDRMEFWEKGENRLHKRQVFEQSKDGSHWKQFMVYP